MVLPGAVCCAFASYYMIRRAALSKSNIATGVIRIVHGKNRFHYLSVVIVEMLEICKFVWPNDIFTSEIYLASSINAVKSKHEFAESENERHMGVAHVTNAF